MWSAVIAQVLSDSLIRDSRVVMPDSRSWAMKLTVVDVLVVRFRITLMRQRITMRSKMNLVIECLTTVFVQITRLWQVLGP